MPSPPSLASPDTETGIPDAGASIDLFDKQKPKSPPNLKINAAFYERRGFLHFSGRLSDHGIRQSSSAGYIFPFRHSV